MKRIISCSDGTWNKPGASDQGKKLSVTDGGKKVKVQDSSGDEDTNVIKMYNAICAEGKDAAGKPVKQVKIYDEGVGTGYSWRDKIGGGITGAGIDKNIKDVYRFFVLNYQPGDELYLFGFSRGAYTARSLGGFIRCCGILKPDYLYLVDKAYELYRNRNVYTHPESDMMRSFRAAYSFEDVTPVHFIGVWDTVGSLGIPVPWMKASNSKRYRFHDCTLSSYVRHAYHALAIDEKRILFKPTLWEQSKNANKVQEQKLEQRWFTGVHSNIGGGYPDCGLSNIALQWMLDKAEDAGLCYNEKPLIAERPERDLGKVVDSYTPLYWLWRPQWRTIASGEGSHNQTVDDSVWKRREDKNQNYRPKNLDGLAGQR